MKREADLQSVKNKAVDLLSRREHSEHELREKLQGKGYEEALVEQAVQSMLDAGYLSDERYVRMIIRSSYEKGHGPQKIRFKLQQKGVKSSMVNEGFEAFEGDWFALAQSLRLRKFREPLNDKDRALYYKEKSRQMRFLAGRGFTMEQISFAFEVHEDDEQYFV
ncbi:hypothetical protein A3752_15035 [Oleiphilus sp. HI0081]|jgi:regulatory protein|uniref:regulatory protein RecX n=1 Tax=unclassified Oleiphilus TaxID=2631174 RepID=UPI0007C20B61|nr:MULTISPECIES: regulatory protein RecX [unclassified Oleiphilus]KZY77579.1 hypothetical protein A3741_09375 [Oleiphilus sp. HI0069]KZY80946.1 hypothetical protein A3740_06365 [Oleiphilus sp. HI0068]KZY87258.1 hypothetical protein A3743_02045 [Oleiphilus sp. HI0072]KZZ19288.1 hypothetical protein A3752_15035 [Oleiphilus sp. HI0081]KZZ20193.1 hypothetical protein A3749_03300 [Oleiphilus sp. HI0078]KZZ33293.1 hypothetical protein A3755_08065 [Oleiphilus sp. HI0085]